MKWACGSGTAELGTRLRVVRGHAGGSDASGARPGWFQTSDGEQRSASRGIPVASGAQPRWFRTSDARPAGRSDGERCAARGEEGSKEHDLRCRAACGPAEPSDGDRPEGKRIGADAGARS
uniref:Uncharacterized protein n=1 Tax=Ananas comosus var. bracteatus TaxID=296719 RepID=A0A6V7QJZ3_ANACO|nr:unnamed protein product [Ananas comosus var. bracteatus]